MISYEFTIQESVAILMDPYNESNEFLLWIKHKHYPVLSWTREGDLLFLNMLQNFNTTSFGKWWIPVRLILKRFSLRNFWSTSDVLSSQKSFLSIFHSIKDDWIMIDNQQAGKYVSRNFLYTFHVIIFQ